MDGNGVVEAMECSSSSSSKGDGALEASLISSFQCCVCLDLLYKPVVLACGHISCFWCIYRAMHGLRASHCAICRQRYYHFPGICQLLHVLLLKMEPLAYKSREKEVLEEEKVLDCFSPQFVDHLLSEKAHADKNNSGTVVEIQISDKNLIASRHTALEENILPDGGLCNGICKQISLADVLCAGCKELLFRPSVLNCGHVYCESCLSGSVNGPLKCQVCHSLHPGNSPKVCLELDHFLEEQFPKEYATRREKVRSALESWERNAKASMHVKDENLWLNEDLSNAHVGIGCDSCGMYPIIGKRYKCSNCKEKVGFDLCEACYNTSSKLPGRFNLQHTPDHRFELDESRMLSKILMLRALQSEEP